MSELVSNLGSFLAEVQSLMNERAELEEKLQKVDAAIEALAKERFGSALNMGSEKTDNRYSVAMIKANEPERKRMRRTEDKEEKTDMRGRAGRKAKEDKEVSAKVPRSRDRIKEETVRNACIDYLKAALPDSRSAGEILEHLSNNVGLPNTTSFRTRVYSTLTKLVKDRSIAKLDRGVYKYVEENN